MNHTRNLIRGFTLILVMLVIAGCAAPTATSSPTTEAQSCPTTAPQSCPTAGAQAMPETDAFRKEPRVERYLHF